MSLFETLPIGPSDFVFVGDSLTEQAEWQELLPGAPVKNRGISGDTVMLLRARIEQVTHGRPAKISVGVGINDVSQGRPPDEIARDMGGCSTKSASGLRTPSCTCSRFFPATAREVRRSSR